MDKQKTRVPGRWTPPNDSVPEWSPRSAAGLSSLILVSVVFGAPVALLILLVPDFLARTLNQRRWTYLAVLAGPFGRRLLSPDSLARRSRWAPKRFASALGLAMLGMILSASLAGYVEIAMLLSAMMSVLTALEAFFGICVACQIYTHILGPLGLVEACPNGRCSL